jgi:cytochrome d ubiquinol oxidase subunit II
MTPEQLGTIAFVLVFLLLAGYAVLDGLGLGVGMLHPLAAAEHQRRISIKAIAPLWMANTVWLLAAAAALFAAFPLVYATVFTRLQLILTMLLAALIVRGVSIHLRWTGQSAAWKGLWDSLFFAGSLASSLLLGVALGNILRGLPFNERGAYLGTFLGLLNPFALLAGVLTALAFMVHGALYLAARTDQEHRHRLSRLLPLLWLLFAAALVIASLAAFYLEPHLIDGAVANPPAYLFLPVIAICAVCLLPLIRSGQFHAALLASSICIACMVGLVAASLYPVLMPNLTTPAAGEAGLTIRNSSASAHTLGALLIITLIGMPMVIASTAVVYWAFAGQVELDEESH